MESRTGVMAMVRLERILCWATMVVGRGPRRPRADWITGRLVNGLGRRQAGFLTIACL